VPTWARVSQLRQPWSRHYIHALFIFAIAYVAQPLSFSHAIHLGFHDLKAKTPRSAVSWSQKTVLFASHFHTANSVGFYTQRKFQKLSLYNLYPPKVLLFYDPISSPIHKFESDHNFVHFLVLLSSVIQRDAKVTLRGPSVVSRDSSAIPYINGFPYVYKVRIIYLLIHFFFISSLPYILYVSNICAKVKALLLGKRKIFRTSEKIHSLSPRFS